MIVLLTLQYMGVWIGLVDRQQCRHLIVVRWVNVLVNAITCQLHLKSKPTA